MQEHQENAWCHGYDPSGLVTCSLSASVVPENLGGVTHLEDSSRVVLVVGNADVAMAALHHDGRLQSRVGHGIGGTRRALTPPAGASTEAVAVLVLDLLPLAVAEVEEENSDNCGDGNDAYNDTGGDTSHIGTLLRWRFCRGDDSCCRLTRAWRRDDNGARVGHD